MPRPICMPIGSSLRPVQLGISARVGILISAYTKKYTKGDTIKKLFAWYLGRLLRTICKKFGDNWTTGTGNMDWFGFPTHSLLENKMRKNVFSAQKSLIFGENIIIFPGGLNKIPPHQLHEKISDLKLAWGDQPIPSHLSNVAISWREKWGWTENQFSDIHNSYDFTWLWSCLVASRNAFGHWGRGRRGRITKNLRVDMGIKNLLLR